MTIQLISDRLSGRWRGLILGFVASVMALTVSGRETFSNPIGEGADPWIVKHRDQYILCASDGNAGVALWVSDRLTGIGQKHIIFQAPERGPHSLRWWAPELHFIDGKWFVYVATSHGSDRGSISRNTRMIVLESETADPLSRYHLKSQLFTGIDIDDPSSDRWAIDGTVLKYHNRLYFIWSGWVEFVNDQHTYIAEMSNPWTVSSSRVLLAKNNDYLWERVNEASDQPGLNEGQQVLQHKGRTFLVYSASGSWQTTYKLGLLELRTGGDPMNPGDWTKHPAPVFTGTEATYGIGHSSFVRSPDDSESWLIYHAKQDTRPGWRRAIYAQPFTFDVNGWPQFGQPVAAGTVLPVPSGTQVAASGEAFAETFATGWARWAYYGHHQEIEVEPNALRFTPPHEGVNYYRTGTKLVLKDHSWTDSVTTVRLRVAADAEPAGLLFRLSQPRLGELGQTAYYAAVQTGKGGCGKVVLGLFADNTWAELASAEAILPVSATHELGISARGDQLEVAINGETLIKMTDTTLSGGTIGLRAPTGKTVFSAVTVDPLQLAP